MKKKGTIREIINIIFLFFYVFQPYICPVSPQLLLDVIIATIALISLFKNKCKLRIKVLRKFVTPFIPFLLYIICVYVVKALADGTNANLYTHNIIILLMVFIRIIMIIWYFYHLIYDLNWSEDMLIRDFVAVAFIQMVCVILAFAIPSIRTFFNSLTLRYSPSKSVTIALSHDIWRSYGFAGNIFDAFGYITALLILITFYYGKKKNDIRVMVLSLIMIVMPLLNARTGLVLVGIGLLILIILGKRDFQIKTILNVVLVILLGILIIPFLWKTIPEITRSWIVVGLESTIQLFTTGEKTGVYSAILQDNYIMPNDIVYGVGADREQLYGIGIESGYINCLWKYGIVGSFLLLAAYTWVFISLIHDVKEKNRKAIIIAFYIIFLVYLVKLFSLYNIGAATVLLGVPFIFWFDECKKGRI